MRTYTLTFNDAEATRVEVAGGKGANLSLLTQRGFPVPSGFVITPAAYKSFIEGTREVLQRVAGFHFDDAAVLREESKILLKTLDQFELPEDIVSEIRRQLQAFGASRAYSVRSSSTMEDLANAAFAGQHETFLNCVGEEMIIRAVKGCYLSLWSDRAIAYRHQQKFDHRLATMAVVVQHMVQAEVAGVAFSVNPVNGNLNEVIVDANYGLGESVVSGQAAVDHWVLDRSSRKVLQSNIAIKTGKVVSTGSGIAEVENEASEAEKPCLSPEQLGSIAELVLKVEASYGFPQDIEWALSEGKVSLLQSRPITTIPPRWTRDESAERFPNVLTPLTWDFVDEGFHRSLKHSFRMIGFPQFNGKWFDMHGHYIYGNQNAVQLYGRRAPFVVRNIEELRAALPTIREQYRWVQELPVAWLRDLDHYLITLGELKSEPMAGKSLQEAWDYVLRVNEHGANYFLPNIAISITHSTIFRLLHYLLGFVAGEKSAALMDELMAFCETKTGMINKELYELACLVRSDEALKTIFQERASKDILDGALLDNHPEFLQRFQKFLQDHGHREVDFDAYSPTWVECPWVVLDNIRLILNMPLEVHPGAKERELKVRMQKAEANLLQAIPEDLQYFFSEILRLARLYTSIDDLEHYQTTRLTPVLRRGLRNLGEMLNERGVVSDPMDVFFARRDQLTRAIENPGEVEFESLSAAIKRQKQEYLLAKARKPQWILGEEESATDLQSEFLKGLPGSPGQAEGKVFIVLTPEEFPLFPKGAVLVTRTTNPTWTPLFYSAAAVITESGGPLSHGAVTAREMRLPAVMSVRNVLTTLRTGQMVRVDGTAGKVYPLKT